MFYLYNLHSLWYKLLTLKTYILNYNIYLYLLNKSYTSSVDGTWVGDKSPSIILVMCIVQPLIQPRLGEIKAQKMEGNIPDVMWGSTWKFSIAHFPMNSAKKLIRYINHLPTVDRGSARVKFSNMDIIIWVLWYLLKIPLYFIPIQKMKVIWP